MKKKVKGSRPWSRVLATQALYQLSLNKNIDVSVVKKNLLKDKVTRNVPDKKFFSKLVNETIKNTTEVIKRLPELPEIMDKANQALTYFASGQIPQNSNSFIALNEKKSEMITLRNQTAIGLLLLVILGLLVF